MTELVDVRLVGDDGECLVFVDFDGEEHVARVLWQPDVAAPDVLAASSPAVERFVHESHEAQDEIEARHCEYVAEHRAWRGGWQRVDA